MSSLPRILASGALFTLLGGLGGCGFQPLYAAPGVTPKLAAIEVSRPDGRPGFLLGQSLDDELGNNSGGRPIYRLTMQLSETRIPRGININNVATRYEVDLTASYQLSEIATRTPVTKGTVTVNATYDQAPQPYASLAAEQDGERRAAEAAAQRIRLELASFFAAPRPDAPTAPIAQPAALSTLTDAASPQPVLTPRERAAGASSTPAPIGTDTP